MNIKKFLRVTGFVLLGVVLLLGILASFLYYQYQGKYKVKSEKYANNVGYLDASNTMQPNEEWKLCGIGTLIGSYHSAAPKIYKGTKLQFKEFILTNFDNKGLTDSGMLNLRFHVNCNGQVGNLEINALNSDFEKSHLSQRFVDQVIQLISQPTNWETFAGEDYNYYMYLNFIIKDGDITEIIP